MDETEMDLKPKELNAETDAPKARGVPSDNIPPSTSNPASHLSTGGEDTVKVSLWVAFEVDRFREMAIQLDKLKAEAQEGGNSAFYMIGGTAWEVNKTGFKLGEDGKKGGPFFRWQLRHGGVRIGLANRWAALKQHGAPNVWAEFGSEMLMVSGGIKPVFDELLETLKAMGAAASSDILSEVHVCADWPEVDIAEFHERFTNHQYISRAKRNTKHHTDGGEVKTSEHGFGFRSTGFVLGSTIQLNVYEKAWEVRNNITKKAILEALRWGGAVEKAVRFEFKIRRETLKAYGIDSVEDWEREKAGFVRWLCEDWFRMTEGEVDRRNTTRAKTWVNWQIVQKLFQDWAGIGPKPPKLGLGIHLDPKSLIQQAVGCISQAMALRGMDATNMGEFIDASSRLLKGYSSIDDITAKLKDKFQALESKSPRKAFFSWGR